MSNSYVTYTGDGATTARAVPFSYIETSHVHVYLNDVETLLFTWVSAGQINITTAPALGVVIRIARETPVDAPLVDFTDGNVRRAKELNNNAKQAIYAAEEAVETVFTYGTEVQADSAAATAAAAAALVSQTAAAGSAVASAADVVLTHADVVLTHADVVLTHADVILAEADKVQTGLDKIATAADRVQTGLDKVAAAASAVAAATAETNAETAETNAELAETNAETAQAAAEAARDLAIVAQLAAEAAEAQAELAEAGAETAEVNAETAQAAAEAAAIAAAAALTSKADIASPTFTGTVGGITKSMVGLGNVDNTTDAGKPVSTAQQTALDLKANAANPAFTGTPTGLTKSHVGLGSVDNTADTAKPVSTAQQTALDLKANAANPAFTGTPTGLTKSHVGLGSVDNTADSAKPVSTAQAAADALKANIASPTFTGTVAGITKSMVGLGNVDNTADTAKPVSTAQQTAIDLKVSAASPSMSGTVTITTTTAADGLRIVNNQAGATGVQGYVFHDSATPAASDVMYSMLYYGRGDDTSLVTYGQDQVVINDPVTGSADATRVMKTMIGGVLTTVLSLGVTQQIGPHLSYSYVYGGGGAYSVNYVTTSVDSVPVTTQYHKLTDDSVGWGMAEGFGGPAPVLEVTVTAGDQPKVKLRSIIMNDPGDTPEVGMIIADGTPTTPTSRVAPYPGAFIYSWPRDNTGLTGITSPPYAQYPYAGRNAQIGFAITEDPTQTARGGALFFSTCKHGKVALVDRAWLSHAGYMVFAGRATLEDAGYAGDDYDPSAQPSLDHAAAPGAHTWYNTEGWGNVSIIAPDGANAAALAIRKYNATTTHGLDIAFAFARNTVQFCTIQAGVRQMFMEVNLAGSNPGTMSLARFGTGDPAMWLRAISGTINSWDVTGSSTGNNILMAASGDDTNISMRFTPKGTGVIRSTAYFHQLDGTAVPANTLGLGLRLSSVANLGVFFGTGAPTMSAAKGSLYIRTDATTTTTRMYINTNASTTWATLTTSA